MCLLLALLWRPPSGGAAPLLKNVEVLQGADGGLVFQLSFDALPNADRVRILLDVDGPVRGEMTTGADYMLEGQVVYRYPARAAGWRWDLLEPTITLIEETNLVCFLPRLPLAGSFSWAVEMLSEDWSVEQRLPESGMIACPADSLSRFLFSSPLQPEDLGELLRALVPGVPVAEAPGAERPPIPAGDARGVLSLGSGDAWRIFARLMDAVSGREIELTPREIFTYSNRVRWIGTDLGLSWALTFVRESEQEIVVWGELKAEQDRCVHVGVGVQGDLSRAIWHDDFYFRRWLSATAGVFRIREVPVSHGRRGRQAVFPLGVVTRGTTAVMAATDPGDPRAFEIMADSAQSFFGLGYDLALTAKASNLAGRATFRCSFCTFPGNGQDDFRKALEFFYKRFPAGGESQGPVCGFARPLQVPRMPRTVDVACDEKDLLLPLDAMSPEQPPRWLSLLFLEPWSYWMVAPRAALQDPAQALRWLTLLTAGSSRESELAASALIGGVRRPDGALDWAEVKLPWHTGLFLRVSADPRLPSRPAVPITRAMAEWRLYKKTMRTSPVHGIYLEPPPKEEGLDYNPAALAVSSLPAAYDTNRWQPGLAWPLAACADIGALAGAVRAAGGYVAGCPTPAQWPFALSFYDFPVGVFATWDGTRCDVDSEGNANLLRALAGLKPVIAMRSNAHRPLTADEVTRHLEWCLFRGFLPGFMDRARGADGVWEAARADESLRQVLEVYLPLTRRLAAAGWRPLGPGRIEPETIWMESFGSRRQRVSHWTLRNTTAEPVQGMLRWPGLREPFVLLDPLSGEITVRASATNADAGFPVTLLPFEIAVRDGFALSQAAEEAAFLEQWTGAVREAAACLAGLRSVQFEISRGLWITVSVPKPAVHGDRNRVRLEVVNRGAEPMSLSELKVVSQRAYRPVDRPPLIVPAGKSADGEAFFETGDLATDPWLEVSWTLEQGGARTPGVRMIKPAVTNALVFKAPARRVSGRDDTALIALEVRNYSHRPRRLEIRWEGDFQDGRQIAELAPDSRSTLKLAVKKKRARSGEVLVRGDSEGLRVFEAWFDVVLK